MLVNTAIKGKGKGDTTYRMLLQGTMEAEAEPSLDVEAEVHAKTTVVSLQSDACVHTMTVELNRESEMIVTTVEEEAELPAPE